MFVSYNNQAPSPVCLYTLCLLDVISHDKIFQALALPFLHIASGPNLESAKAWE